MTSASVLQSLAGLLASGGIEVVDCSGVLGPETPLGQPKNKYMELGPRDKLSQAFWQQQQAGLTGDYQGHAVVYLDLRHLGPQKLAERLPFICELSRSYVNIDPVQQPIPIRPAVHYTMGGLWVDYNLMSNVEGLFVLGEANFSDHGANRLGASALMQGLADGYFVLPYTISDYLANDIRTGHIPTDSPEFEAAEADVKTSIDRFLQNKGSKSVDHFHKRLGLIMWNKVGMGRNEEGLKTAIEEIAALREEFYRDVKVPGDAYSFNQELDKAGRVADFLELGELMCIDALNRNESCGGHFREDHATPEGEAERDDVNFKYVGAWEYQTDDITTEVLHKEELIYENIEVKARSYK